MPVSSAVDDTLIDTLRTAFRAAADPERAAGQQAYMKSAMPYYGIRTPDLRRLCRGAFRRHPLETRAAWLATLEALWWRAEYREERYAALELLGDRRYRPHFDAALIETLAALISSGAWWDYVDQIAVNYVGALLKAHPLPIRPRLEAWSRADDIWLRRAAILAQLKFKTDTDWPLQQALMAPSLASREFFLRKGVGWALREYSKTAPERVIAYVREQAGVLSGLSKREGLKVLLKQGAVSRDDPVFSAPRISG